MHDAVNKSSCRKPVYKRKSLPKHKVRMLRLKKRRWEVAKLTGDFNCFKQISHEVRSAIRQHHRNQEQRLIYNSNRKPFFHYIYSKCGKRCSTITLSRNDVSIPDRESAEAFQQEFANNFNVVCGQKSTSHSSSIKCVTALSDMTLFNSNEHLVSHAISQCSNSNSSPDGISFKLIKMIARIIIKPLNIIFQHAFNESIFPAAWKHVIVLPLFKGRGERCDPSSYRPISLYPCLDKILEKVIHAQLTIYLNDNNLLCQFQHGFTAGRSTTTNMLHFDNAITDILSANHAFDIIAVDFKKAFNKAPHDCVLQAVEKMGIRGKALSWLGSFLTGRTQQVLVGDSLSSSVDVTSGIVQGSTLGPDLFTIFADSLLRSVSLPVDGFVDDIKFWQTLLLNLNPKFRSN